MEFIRRFQTPNSDPGYLAPPTSGVAQGDPNVTPSGPAAVNPKASLLGHTDEAQCIRWRPELRGWSETLAQSGAALDTAKFNHFVVAGGSLTIPGPPAVPTVQVPEGAPVRQRTQRITVAALGAVTWPSNVRFGARLELVSGTPTMVSTAPAFTGPCDVFDLVYYESMATWFVVGMVLGVTPVQENTNPATKVTENPNSTNSTNSKFNTFMPNRIQDNLTGTYDTAYQKRPTYPAGGLGDGVLFLLGNGTMSLTSADSGYSWHECVTPFTAGASLAAYKKTILVGTSGLGSDSTLWYSTIGGSYFSSLMTSTSLGHPGAAVNDVRLFPNATNPDGLTTVNGMSAAAGASGLAMVAGKSYSTGMTSNLLSVGMVPALGAYSNTPAGMSSSAWTLTNNGVDVNHIDTLNGGAIGNLTSTLKWKFHYDDAQPAGAIAESLTVELAIYPDGLTTAPAVKYSGTVSASTTGTMKFDTTGHLLSTFTVPLTYATSGTLTPGAANATLGSDTAITPGFTLGFVSLPFQLSGITTSTLTKVYSIPTGQTPGSDYAFRLDLASADYGLWTISPQAGNNLSAVLTGMGSGLTYSTSLEVYYAFDTTAGATGVGFWVRIKTTASNGAWVSWYGSLDNPTGYIGPNTALSLLPIVIPMSYESGSGLGTAPAGGFNITIPTGWKFNVSNGNRTDGTDWLGDGGPKNPWNHQTGLSVAINSASFVTSDGTGTETPTFAWSGPLIGKSPAFVDATGHVKVMGGVSTWYSSMLPGSPTDTTFITAPSFILACSTGKIFRSTNGTSWTDVTPSGFSGKLAGEWSIGRSTIIGITGGKIWTSVNGTSWSSTTPPVLSGVDATGITTGTGMRAFCVRKGTLDIFWSDDLVNWYVAIRGNNGGGSSALPDGVTPIVVSSVDLKAS